MKTGMNGLHLITEYEGLRLQAYKCPADIWTIGYGHTAGVSENDVITEEEALFFCVRMWLRLSRRLISMCMFRLRKISLMRLFLLLSMWASGISGPQRS